MRNKLLKLISVFFVVFSLTFCIAKVNNVKADSGWDSSYDSGSSWDSGSDWGSSSWDSDSASSGGEFGTLDLIFFDVFTTVIFSIFFAVITSDKTVKGKNIKMIIIIAIRAILLLISCFTFKWVAFIDVPLLIILIIVYMHRVNSGKDDFDKYKQISKEIANKIITDFDIKEFNFEAYKIFYDVQIGWMEFDYDKLKELLTDELYNTYYMDLEVLKSKNQKNIMKDFELVETKLIGLKEENGKYIAKVMLEVKFIDYIEDSNTHKVLRGSSGRKLYNTYILTFESTKEEKTVNICPQCGAPVEGNTTGICEYCKSKLINETYDWVLSKKEKISQR